MSLNSQVHKKILELDPESFLYQLFEYILDNIFESLDGSEEKTFQKNLVSNFGTDRVQLLADVLADQLSGKIPYNNALSALMVLKNRYDIKSGSLSGSINFSNNFSKKKSNLDEDVTSSGTIETRHSPEKYTPEKHSPESPTPEITRTEKSSVTELPDSSGVVSNHSSDRNSNYSPDHSPNTVANQNNLDSSSQEKLEKNPSMEDQSGTVRENPDQEVQTQEIETEKTQSQLGQNQQAKSDQNHNQTASKPFESQEVEELKQEGQSQNTEQPQPSESAISTEKDIKKSTEKSVEKSVEKQPESNSEQGGGTSISAKSLYQNLQKAITGPDTPAAIRIVIKDIGIEIENNKVLVSLSNTLLLKQITSPKCIDYLKNVWQLAHPNIWQSFELEAYKRNYKEFDWNHSQTKSPDNSVSSSSATFRGIDSSQNSASQNRISQNSGPEKEKGENPQSWNSGSAKPEKTQNAPSQNSLNQNNSHFDDGPYFDSSQGFYPDEQVFYDSYGSFSDTESIPGSSKTKTEGQTKQAQGANSAQPPKIQAPKIQNNKNNFRERPLKKDGKYFYAVYAPEGQNMYNIADFVERLTVIKDPEESLDFQDVLDDFDLE